MTRLLSVSPQRCIQALAVTVSLLTAGCGAVPLVKSVLGGVPKALVPNDLESAHRKLQGSIEFLANGSLKAKKRTVKLHDLGADMARFEGQASVDFLSSAKEADGTRITFIYLETGEEEYDGLIKDVVVTKALVYQTVTTLNRLAQLSAEILGKPVLINAGLRDLVASALLKTKGSKSAQAAELAEVRRLAKACAFLVPKYSGRVAQIQRRIARLKGRLQDPKALLVLAVHLPAVIENLQYSFDALKQTAEWSASALPHIVTFGRAHGGQNAILDINNGRLDRTELAALLYDPPED